MKPNVLFVCVHNSGRSQMAEAFMRRFAGDAFAVHSAGIEPGTLNPHVVQAMAEIGYDISRARTKSIADTAITRNEYRHVVTVCAESEAAQCPIFPTAGRREHWFFADPAAITSKDPAVLMHAVRSIRDRMLERVRTWAQEKQRELDAERVSAG
ncbi:MAG: arsenate reductase ArsC [Vulcanimicrobiaceae bacterium]|jgi:arsenate reductase